MSEMGSLREAGERLGYREERHMQLTCCRDGTKSVTLIFTKVRCCSCGQKRTNDAVLDLAGQSQRCCSHQIKSHAVILQAHSLECSADW